MTAEHARKTLQVALEDPATPARVSRLAYHLDQVLRAACPDLQDGEVTIDVRNYVTKVDLKPRSDRGQDAVDRSRRVATRPADVAREQVPTLRAWIATAKELKSVTLRSSRAKRSRIVGNDFLTRAETRIAELESAVRGDTVIYTTVLRVGRSSEDAKERVLVSLGDSYRDIRFDPGVRAELYAAAQSRGLVRATLSGTWKRDASGLSELDTATATITAVQPHTPKSGAELLAQWDETCPGGIEDVEDFLLRARG